MNILTLFIPQILKSFLHLYVPPKDLTGRTVLITGGNRGVGLYTAILLAKMNAKVIIASRRRHKSQTAIDQIKRESGNQNIEYRFLDLSDIDGVKYFCENFKTDFDTLDYLVNNAGATFLDYGATVDDLERTFHINYLGPFILTLNLLPIIQKSYNPRIVNVSSLIHHFGTIKLPVEIHSLQENYHFLREYANSKLMVLLFTKELSRRLKDKNILVVAVNPGFVKSSWVLNGKPNIWAKLTIQSFLLPNRLMFARSSEQGAMASVFAIINDKVKTGEYYDGYRVAESHPVCRDIGLAKILWDYTIDLANLDSNIV